MTVSDKWDLTGVHALNRFLWSKLQSDLEWNSANYGGLIPIVVPQQQPEFNNYNAPYVVYNYTHQTGGEDFWLQEEQISYAIYSANEKEIRQFINLMKTYFERRDESAALINNWILTPGNTNVDARHKRFDYKYTYVISTSGAQPAVTEGGRMDGLVILRIAYTYYETTAATAGQPRGGSKDRLAL